MIKNKTKHKILCQEQKILRSVFSKAIGLMFSKRIIDKGLVFVFDKQMKVDLHMFFVFFPIDVIFLDEDKKVVDLKKEFRPFTIYLSKEKAKYIIELPEKTIDKSKTEIGDKIEF